MYVLVLIMSVAPGYFQVQAINHVYPTMELCKISAKYISSDLMRNKPTPESTVSAYCTEIPVKV